MKRKKIEPLYQETTAMIDEMLEDAEEGGLQYVQNVEQLRVRVLVLSIILMVAMLAVFIFFTIYHVETAKKSCRTGVHCLTVFQRVSTMHL